MIQEPDKELIEKCQKGDIESFRMLYRHCEKFIFAYCLRLLSNQQDAEDAVQTIFLNLYRGMKNFNFKSRFTTYLISITRNVCYNMLNRQKYSNGDLRQEESVAVNHSDFKQDLIQAISTLPARMRECFVLFAIEQYPQAEIAEMLNIKTGTVKALIFQARQKLVTWLNE